MKDFVKPGVKVWVNTGMPSYEPNGNHVAKVRVVPLNAPVTLQFTEDKDDVEFVDIANLAELIPAPIDEKNVVSDWITQDFLDDASFYDSTYLGWIQHGRNSYPMYGWIDSLGRLCLQSLTNDDIAYELAKERINDLFDCNPDNEIVSCKWFETGNHHMIISFYYLAQD